jgi:undecaprenyl pyrophosphate phosphatase UppP
LIGHVGAEAAIAWGPTLAAGVVSLVVGVASLKLLLGAVRRAKLHYFTFYCWLLGGLILAGLI